MTRSHSDSDSYGDEADRDVVMVDRTDVSDFNPGNILPESPSVQAAIIEKLAPTKYDDDSSEYQKHLSFHLAGSCDWIFSTSAYQQWRTEADTDADHTDGPGNILWVRGPAGSGKSVLTSALIKKLSQEEGCPVLYFFFRHGITSNHSPTGALRDWLAQALPFSPPLQAELKQRTQNGASFSLADLFGFLRLALEHLPKVYVFVDALDEMDQQSLEQFLQQFDEMAQWRPRNVKLIMTSRPIAVIAKMMRSVRVLDIPLDNRVESDVAAYLTHRLASSWVPMEDRPRVAQAILSRCDGLFLYAKLAIDRVLEQHELDSSTLAAIPSGLSVMYADILREQSARTDIPAGLQQLILKCVTHATRPLRLLEISDLVNATQAGLSSEGDLGMSKALVRSACGPLLQILPDETIHVAHHSVTEFLNGSTTIRDTDSPAYASAYMPGPTHNEMALLCISYLRTGCLDPITFAHDDLDDRHYVVPESKQKCPPFTTYAAQNWHVHARKAMLAGHDPSEVNAQALDLLETPDVPKKVSVLAEDGRPSGSTPLGLAASSRLTSFVKHILERADVEKTPIDKERPLQHAVSVHEDTEIIRLLLDHGADPKAFNLVGLSALHLAVYGKRYKAVKLLLDAGISAFLPDGEDQTVDDGIIGERKKYTPAHHVFRTGDAELVSLFLPYLDTAKRANWALEKAVKWKMYDTMERLLAHPLVSINVRVSAYTPLYLACSKRNATAIEMLLKAGADPNIVHNETSYHQGQGSEEQGCNVLHALAGFGHPFHWLWPYEEDEQLHKDHEGTRRCFKLVLEAGARLDQTDFKGNNPLHVAKDVTAVECLLDAGIDPNATTRSGETLLHTTRCLDITKMLAPRVDINARAQYGGATPLLSLLIRINSRLERDFAKASELLDYGADAAAIDDEGNGTLHYAIPAIREPQGAGISLLNRLIAGGANINIKNAKGKTPAHIAVPGSSPGLSANDGMTVVLKTLVAAGADLEAKDHQGQTPLYQMMSCPTALDAKLKISLAEEMISAGARIEMLDAEGRNLLHSIVSTLWPSIELIRFLVARGIDPQQTDARGNTIWHLSAPKLAARAPNPKLFSELSPLNVDPLKTNNDGESPMHIVVKFHPSAFGPKNSFTSWGRATNADDMIFFDHFLALCRKISGDNSSKIIDCVDNNGVSPLHIASTFSEYLTRRLLEEGADIARQTSEGLTVLHLAARSRETNVLGLLLAWLKSTGGPTTLSKIIKARDSLNRSPLYYACASGCPETVHLLLDSGASVTTDTYAGSPWQGCVALQDEEKNGNWRWCQGMYDLQDQPDAAGVLISDTRRGKVDVEPSIFQEFQGRHSFLEQRLDEIVELLVLHGGGGQHLNQALDSAIERQFDHATECLLRALESLGANGPYVLDEDTSARLLLRAIEATKPRHGQAEMIMLLAARQFSLFKTGILANPVEGILQRLASGGFVMLIHQIASREDGGYGLPVEEDSTRWPPLLVAACRRSRWNMSMIRLLVEKLKVDLNAGMACPQSFLHPVGDAPLHILVRRGRWWQIEEALPYLLSRGADTEVRDERGMTPLAAALESIKGAHFSRKAVETLLQHGADPNAEDSRGKSCLSMIEGNSDIYQLLIRHGATVSPSTIMDMITRRDVSLLEASLAGGFDPNTRKIPEVTPEARRQTFHSEDLEKYPLELVVQHAAKQTDGQTEASERMVRVLLEHGADPSARYPKTTVMHRLLDGHHGHLRERTESLYAILLQSPKLDLEAQDDSGRTLLHLVATQPQQPLAAMGGRTLTQVLLDAGADIRATDNLGLTVLHHTLKRDSFTYFYKVPPKDLNMERIIGSAPELVHSVDDLGRTPLHAAIDGRITSLDDVYAVIDAGSDITSLVKSTGDNMFHLLFRRSWVVKLNGEVRVGETPCHQYPNRPKRGGAVNDEKKTDSSEKQELGILQRVLDNGGVDVNARNKQGMTPVFGFFEQDQVSAEVIHTDPPPDNTNQDFNRNLKRQRMEMEMSLEKEHLIWQLFDDLGVDWTATSETGTTLLHIVAEASTIGTQRRVQRFKFLMSKGLDPMAEDTQHRTPLDINAATGRKDIVVLFE